MSCVAQLLCPFVELSTEKHWYVNSSRFNRAAPTGGCGMGLTLIRLYVICRCDIAGPSMGSSNEALNANLCNGSPAMPLVGVICLC